MKNQNFIKSDGIDRLLDMMRTAVNITGDSMVSVITAKSEKSFDEKIFLDFSKYKTNKKRH